MSRRSTTAGPVSTPPRGRSAVAASSQSSRFHAEDVGIDLKTVNISVGARDLLKDANVQLLSGNKYGLIGRNGVGKSILMRCLSDGSLLSPALRETLRVLYIDQTLGEVSEEGTRQTVAGKTSSTISPAKARGKAVRAKTTSNNGVATASGQGVVESSALSSSTATLTALEELLRKPYASDDLELTDLERWRALAEQQSGQRGHRARQRLLELEASMDRLSVEYEEAEGAVDNDYDDADGDADNFDGHDGYNHDMHAHSKNLQAVLKSMKISEDMLAKPLNSLSGGWRMRIALAKALLYPPDLLLLDEPTNHLDISGIAWLEKCIKNKFGETTVVLVSHNRSFLNNVTDHTILFKNQILEFFTGNYDQYLQAQDEKQAYNERMQDALDRKRTHMEKSIAQSAKLARQQGDDKRLKQVASRKVKLEERVGMERNAKGHRFKLNRDRPGYHFGVRDDVEHIEEENTQARLKFTLPAPELPRFTGPLLVVEDVRFERRNKSTGETVFRLQGVTFAVEPGQRVALLGPNGQGKSTLLNLIAQTWTPTSGTIQRRSNLIGYFQQNIVVELGAEIERSPLQRLTDIYPSAKQADLWKHLGAFGLGAQQIATQMPLAQLSGGQRVAYAFAELSYASPSLLLLDEPNSHLDLDALDALAEALVDFPGAIVFVSHDLAFVDQVATDMFWVDEGRAVRMENGIDEVPSRLKRGKRMNPGAK